MEYVDWFTTTNKGQGLDEFYIDSEVIDMYIADTYSISSCKTTLVLGVHGNPNINGKGVEEDI